MIVAWIWSIIWYMGLDPIKWVMMYILNEDGVRDRSAFTQAKKVHGSLFLTRSTCTTLLESDRETWQ